MNKQSWLMLCIIFVLMIAMPMSVKALGINSAYFPGNPLTLQPGETKTIGLGLTNLAGEPQNFTMIAEITQGVEIAQLTEKDKQYSVPFGTDNDIAIGLTVTAPTEAPIGTEYSVEVIVTTITTGAGGGVVLGQSIGKTIPVTIVSPTVEITPTKQALPAELIILIILIIIVLVAIIMAIISMKKKKQK